MHKLRYSRIFHFLPLLALAALLADSASAQIDQRSDPFETHIRPILFEKCISCHGSTKQWAGLRLDSKDGLDKGGESGPVIQASNLQASPMLERILSKDPDQMMPPPDSKLSLDDRQKELLAEWILQGAWFPEGTAMLAQEKNALRAKGGEHWAFQPPIMRTPKHEIVVDSDHSIHWIDGYLNSKLAEHDLKPLGMADRRTTLRRLHLVTTGLLPSWDQVQSFEQDSRPDAWERTLDELLCQPQYSEKWT